MRVSTRRRCRQARGGFGRVVSRVLLVTVLVAVALVGFTAPAGAAPTWSVVPSPTPAGANANGTLSSVSCTSASNCFAVSASQDQGVFKTFAVEWNGISWSRVATVNSPLAGQHGSGLTGVSCFGAFCMAVGYYFAGPGITQRTLAERWNGTSWSIVASPNPGGATGAQLNGVSCTSATSCFAVGESAGTAFIERWNGSTWSIVTSPNPAGATRSRLAAVSCATADRCAAAGSSTVGGTTRAFVVRWNGTKWLLSPVPTRSGAVFSWLTGVACPTTIRCFAVGWSSNAQGADRTLIYRWNGTAWATNVSPTPAGNSHVALNGVSCASTTSCEAVGTVLTAGFNYQGFVERWNGTSWSQTTVNAPVPRTGGLNGVSCVSDASCFAVGDSSVQTLSWSWTVQWNGSNWSTVASPNPTKPGMSLLQSVSCSAASECLAVGDRFATNKPLAERWNGSTWSTVATPSPAGTDATLSRVSCATTTSCFAVGRARSGSTTHTLVEQWNGASWSEVVSPNPSGTNDALYGVSCPSATSCFAVGGSGSGTLVVRWNGSSWSSASSPNPAGTAATLSGVSCTSSTSCVAVGNYYTGSSTHTLVERWNGTSWAIVASPNRAGADANFLVNVSCSSDTWCVAVGYSYTNSATGLFVGRTLVERWNGLSWAIATSPGPPGDHFTLLNDVSCASNSSCVAVGQSSAEFRCGCDESRPTLGARTLIERWNGTSWSIEPSPEPAGSVDRELNGVSCLTGLPCFAVGAWQNGAATHTLVKRYS